MKKAKLLVLAIASVITAHGASTLAFDADFISGVPMNQARMAHNQLALDDGTVLVFGGHGTGFVSLVTAEALYPGAHSFDTLSMLYSHDWPAFAVRGNGEVLLAGGSKDSGIPGYTWAETFDPTTELFSATARPLNRLRTGCGAAYLTGGKALIAGGWYTQSDAYAYGELYDPGTRTFTATGALNASRAYPVVLPDNGGNGVVLGGYHYTAGTTIDKVELYQTATNAFSVLQESLFPPETGWGVNTLTRPIQDQALSNGRYLLLASRYNGSVYQYRLFTYDPETRAIEPFETTPALPDSSEFAFLQPVVDRGRGKARLLAFNMSFTGQGNEYYLFSLDLANGGLEQSDSAHVLPYNLGWGGLTLLPNGNLFATGGSVTNNFDPVSETLVIVPYDQDVTQICSSEAINIQDETYQGTWLIRTETTLTTAGAVVVLPDAHVSFEAQESIVLGSGFAVNAGGRFHASVAPVSCEAAI
ncbi:3-coathanger stack domain-containing protein [Allochromatium palmeri]|uniref:Kelch-like protein n=1 Tax=Allochromatium palmeri TaxID=231048 RepID=A0A6N8EFV9_9GAMM|nr:3-coathanger stack domain-containing protein [Allochromatium palmeri]MTW23202.1 hypothetical protein [Allochromatium palmeri]